ncbi:gliding motility protein GldN [Flavobacteriaceae bacterium]|nr:gliding motility protein GldN [Flavobacteriaceae bacterium]
MDIKKIILTVFCLLVLSNGATAQLNILNAKTPEEIGLKTEDQLAYDNDQPLPYGFIDNRDVLWSKTTWELIDLDERINFPLYFPIDTNDIGVERRSLFDVLIKNIKNKNIEEVYEDSYFTKKITMSDIENSLIYLDKEAMNQEYNDTGVEDLELIDEYQLGSREIQEWRIRGYWFLDKRSGELKYRLLGIAPVAKEARSLAPGTQEYAEIELFWVWYPAAREILHKAKAFNRKNTSRPISFDHLLNSRRFNSIIYREDNDLGDRTINDYINDNALMQLLESDRIKEVIRNIEIDMWNY